jgi:5-formyltetrahydrofolate cyclo-ligase
MAPPTSTHSNHSKARLRHLFHQKRKALSSEARAQKSSALLQWIHTVPAFASAKHMAFYWPMGAEISPLALLLAAEQQHKHCYLPCLQSESSILDFVAYQSEAPLILNRFGCLEPDPHNNPCIALCDLDLILIPLLAFDTYGQRLGRGAGYYDRTLATCLQGSRRPYLLGLGYASQGTDRLPTDAWDVPLEGILTEKGLSTPINFTS